MFVGAYFRTRNILTDTSFLQQGIFTCLFICVGDNIKLDVGESTLDVGEQTVGETTGYHLTIHSNVKILPSSLTYIKVSKYVKPKL